jgi:hypothetical protein
MLCTLTQPLPKGEEQQQVVLTRGFRRDCNKDRVGHQTKGWARELWIKALGMKAVLPPPEEEKKVKTAIGAARAQQARTDML